MELHQVLQPIS